VTLADVSTVDLLDAIVDVIASMERPDFSKLDSKLLGMDGVLFHEGVNELVRRRKLMPISSLIAVESIVRMHGPILSNGKD